MTLIEKLNAHKFVVTTEVGPPKGLDLAEVYSDLELVRGRVDGVNVTDMQNSVMRLGSLATCRLLKERGHEPVFQLTCRDRNRLALQSDLLSAAALGIENVLLLTGDYPLAGDHPEAKPVFDVDSVQLIDMAHTLAGGKDMKGNALKGVPKFCVGAVVNPGADPLEPEIIKMKKKIDAGAVFFQTQAVFDAELFARFLQETKHLGVPVIAGIVLLKSGKMARFMNENIAGVNVPDGLIAEMDAAVDKPAASVAIAARIICQVKELCQGIHIMPIGWGRKVPLVLDAAGL